jgi:TatD DNase family protein
MLLSTMQPPQHPSNPDGWVDSHTHLDLVEQRHGQIPSLAELRAVLTIATKKHHAESLKEYCTQPNIYRTAGVHPDHITDISDWEWLRDACKESSERRNSRLIAIGEVGLDGTIETPMDAQIAAFEAQLDIAQGFGLPVVMHTREAESETLQVLRNHPNVTGVAHCFTGSAGFARAVVELGWYVSFSGILTFKNAAYLHEIPRQIPISRILVETDAPYLAPEPFRGKLNHSEYVRYTGERLAGLLGVGVTEVRRATTENFGRLFGLSYQ